jgi:hypothetical protein
MNSLAAEAFGKLGGPAAKAQGGALAGEADDLNIVPSNAVAQTGADGFETGFFGGKAGGKALSGVGLAQAVAGLLRGENAAKKTLAKTLHRGLDPGDFSDVNSCAYNHLWCPAKVPYRWCRYSKVTLISQETTQDFQGYNVPALFRKRCTAALHHLQPACTTLKKSANFRNKECV